ncbi:MAG TPA: hypothetical protein VGO01_12425, partial [Bradyrhizobium sp.]|nr:hypothetical protein [Bradyrhizobium sp.]
MSGRRKTLRLHPYRRHTSTPTHFCLRHLVILRSGLLAASRRMAASACGRILRDAAQDARLLRMTKRSSFFVIAGLDPAIHLFEESCEERWMRGSSPRMAIGAAALPAEDEILTMMDLD